MILQWQYGRRGQDGWAKWTRRRKWYRDAELVEIDDAVPPQPQENGLSKSPKTQHKKNGSTANEKPPPPRSDDQPGTDDDGASMVSTSSKSSFWPVSFRKRAAEKLSSSSEKEQQRHSTNEMVADDNDDDASGLDLETELELQKQGKDGGRWGIGDDARMNLE